MKEAPPTVIEQIKLGFVEVAQSFWIDLWLARQTPERVMPIVQKVIEGIEEEFADAVASGGGIYAVGYCFGAKYVLLLGSELSEPLEGGKEEGGEDKAPPKSSKLIKAGALAHGTWSLSADHASFC